MEGKGRGGKDLDFRGWCNAFIAGRAGLGWVTRAFVMANMAWGRMWVRLGCGQPCVISSGSFYPFCGSKKSHQYGISKFILGVPLDKTRTSSMPNVVPVRRL